MVIARLLSRMGINFTKSYNGAEALSYINQPDLHQLTRCTKENCTYFNMIITDLEMPIMNGIQLTKEARKIEGPVSYTHLRAHETGRNLVCRLLLEKKKNN
eukprot:TRINITY_DN3014_c0_g1_i3.p1 TRINITY_DN3014_c0_g1~~TRINITY_DN3014_c0_g1_i3.p1  ORF type:complete len:101 (-),score=20.14 TRINITY_DN3014_c0_g1_i3:6-308(-)